MTKKIISIFIILLCFFGISNVEAAGQSNFIDMQTYTSVYKLSEDSDVKLPFIKFFNEDATFDRKIKKSGLSIAAKSIEIAEEIDGLQVMISSDTIDVKGSIEYGIIMASNVAISGTIEKDIFIFAESIFITETANIKGDVIAIADTIELRGNILGNFIGNSTNFLMKGSVQEDFRVRSESIAFNENKINGDIYIETNSDLDIFDKYPNAVVNKMQTNIVTEAERNSQRIETILNVITAVILFVLLNMIIKKIKPELFTNLANKVKENSSYTVIIGVFMLVTIPLVMIIAFICSMLGLGVVTTPLFAVYIAILIVTIALAKFVTGSVIYELLKERMRIDSKWKEVGALLSIFTLIYIACYIPYISWFITMATVLFSTGIIMTGITKKK